MYRSENTVKCGVFKRISVRYKRRTDRHETSTAYNSRYNTFMKKLKTLLDFKSLQ